MKPAVLGSVLAELMPSGLLKARRLSTALSQVASASPRHAGAVQNLIARGLRGDPARAPRDLAPLLSLLHELVVAAAVRPEDPEARAWLESQKQGGLVAKLRNALLAL